MTTETKLQIHNITSKAALYYVSENWIMYKTETPKLEGTQTRFLRPLLGLTRLDRQRNSDICNRLKVNNLIQVIKLCPKSWKEWAEVAYPN
jgi:hypothetical protein